MVNSGQVLAVPLGSQHLFSVAVRMNWLKALAEETEKETDGASWEHR